MRQLGFYPSCKFRDTLSEKMACTIILNNPRFLFILQFSIQLNHIIFCTIVVIAIALKMCSEQGMRRPGSKTSKKFFFKRKVLEGFLNQLIL